MGEVGGSDDWAAAVDYEQLGVQHGSIGAAFGGPAPAADANDRPERLGLRTGVRTGAVCFGFEGDIDLAAAADGSFQIGGDFGEGVGGEAVDQDALGGIREQFVQDRAG